jgi:SAM-dependent methyltransferase
MLERLVESAGGQQPFPLFLADAMRLPLADSSVDAVLAAHVLHLLPRWQDAVDEVLRVLRPGGVFLVDFGNLRLDAAAPWNAECRQVLGRLGVVQVRPGVSEPEPVVQHLAGRAVLRPLTPVTMTVQRTLGQDVTAWEQQLYSWTWPFPADTMRQAAAEVRAWAEATGWPIDREVPIDYVIRWWAFDLV